MRKHGRHTHAHVVHGEIDWTHKGSSLTPSTFKARSALSQLGPVVYAIRCLDGVIKIGHTTRLGHRCNQIGGDLLAFRFGTCADEQALHGRLVEHLHHGREWYWPTPGVLAVVNEMRATFGLAPVA